MKNLQGPTASFNALRCEKEAEMQQLVPEMATELGRVAPQPSVYRKTLVQLPGLAKAERPSLASEALLSAIHGGAQPPKRIIRSVLEP
jgi:hypothetical protein